MLTKKSFSLIPAVCVCIASTISIQAANRNKKNVLFIIVDDLRPELGCYGATHIQSPNIDKLAAQGTLFQNSYCNIPVSGASRASLFTGGRPDYERFLTFETWISKEHPNAVTLPQQFKNAGYYTVTNSKVIHHERDMAEGWNEIWMPERIPSYRDYLLPQNRTLDNPSGTSKAPAFEMTDVPDNAYADGKTADKTIADLNRLSKSKKPFFLAAGFLKPHLPFNAPKKYWDLYNPNEIKFPANYKFEFPSIPKSAFNNFAELRLFYSDIPQNGPLTDESARNLIHGYYASVSYIDAQIGKVLNELKRLKLDKNTIVVLVGDNGWNLGDHGMWCKHCSFQSSLSVPMIVKVPGIKSAKVNSVVELVDVYPTLCELCNVPQPPNKQLQGNSFVATMKNPTSEGKPYVVCKWKKTITLVSPEYSYSEWQDKNDSITERMLFDLQNDKAENTNIVNDVDPALIKKLSTEIKNRRGY